MASTVAQLGIEPNDVIEIAYRAGELVTTMRENGLRNVRTKSSASDIVTEADVAAEKLLHQELLALDRTFGFWGEESNQQPEENAFWLVDPIDGTNNFAMGVPFFAVNIALNNGGETVIGVTLSLPSQRVYWAAAGEGAWLRQADGSEARILVSEADELAQAFLTTGFPYHRGEHADNNSSEHEYFLSRAQGVRCFGAAAMDLAFVACGALSGYWESWINPWDAAPGALLVREAGGLVTNYAGEPWALTDKSIIASNGRPGVHDAMVGGIRAARATLASPLF